MADQPKSTADILAAIRKKQGAAPGGETPPAAEPTAAAATPTPADAPVAATKPAGPAPTGTSSILANIRGGGAPKPAGEAKPAAPAGTASILSSIRGGGGAAPAAAGAKPAAATPAAAAKALPAGDKPSVQDMIRAVKEGKPAAEPGKVPAPTKFPTAAPVAKKPVEAVPRRSVFWPVLALVSTPFAFAWTLMTLLGGIFTLKGAQFMMPNMVLELPSKFKVGVASDFPLGSVSEKYKASRGVWIVHTDSYDGRNLIYALASVCTHLGCTPSWLQGEQKFKCPCHGSGFYISGVNFEGPAPRPLERIGISVSDDGQLQVDKSVKFQEELGQWADAKSFVELV
jgi:cytochrome b6-f complex iron-sulfur subunit